ncbi:Lysozyme RrrD [Andreprevotia sp. IGB-42]|uniref:lysozyme n=1 Tax=Andreprevotia sp. IGB-42 TaxID=2497473 RepID=UPI00135AA070|nr:lysozyme [Andreprevotia sp. IGB-42]KAF0813583.1 Lysozyme RrrD [Andreprevotia sp. IGB-42]
MSGIILPSQGINWPIAWDAVRLIALSEGCKLRAYLCPAGVWTIGWGQTDHVKRGMVWTQAQADDDLCAELAALAREVRNACHVDTGANELGALCSLAYNIGVGAFRKSTVLRQHNAGNPQAAARAFALWNKAAGKVLPGLASRRAREAALYLTPDDDADYFETAMPQQVEGEQTLAGSPIAQSGAASVATGLATGAAALTGDVKTTADALGLSPLLIIAAVLLAVGCAVLYQRYRQRAGGWA